MQDMMGECTNGPGVGGMQGSSQSCVENWVAFLDSMLYVAS